MIIGINGYAGVGKDTVGKIIQYTLCKNVGGVSLEDVIADKEGHHDWWLAEQSRWEIKKFAGKLKQIASLLTGIPVEKFEDQNFKKTYLGEEWSYSVALDRDTMLQEHKYWEEKQMTVREFLQKLGTDAIRDNLHTNAWVNALFADYKPKNLSKNWNNADEKLWIQQRYGVYKHDAPDGIFHYQEYPKWLITDTRFPNEAQAIKEKGGIIIRVDRPGVTAVNPHPSETGLDSWNFDYIINNDGSLEKLSTSVLDILQKEKIIQ